MSNAIQPVPLTNFHLHRQTPNQEMELIPEADCSERSYISIQKDINRSRHIRRKKRSRSQSNPGLPNHPFSRAAREVRSGLDRLLIHSPSPVRRGRIGKRGVLIDPIPASVLDEVVLVGIIDVL